MYLAMDKKEISEKFEESLLHTNRGYNYYVDWSNITGLDSYQIEIHALDVLIRCEDKVIKKHFSDLLRKLPSVLYH